MKVTVFDVGRGSAAMVKLPSNNEVVKVGVVDCFHGLERLHPLLEALKQADLESPKGIEIAFLALTHLHRDHVTGLADIIEAFGDRIKLIAEPGIDPRQIAAALYPTLALRDKEVQRSLDALTRFKKQFPSRVRCLASPGVVIYEDSARELSVCSIAPPGDMLTRVQASLERFLRRARVQLRTYGSYKRAGMRVFDLNHSSSAIEIMMGRTRLVFGGDVYRSTWETVLSESHCRSDYFMLSHHGASSGFPKKIWCSHIHKARAHLVVSGKGPHQPSQSVLDFLRGLRVPIYGTNVTKRRGGPRSDLVNFALRHGMAAQVVANRECGPVITTVDERGVDSHGPMFM